MKRTKSHKNLFLSWPVHCIADVIWNDAFLFKVFYFAAWVMWAKQSRYNMKLDEIQGVKQQISWLPAMSYYLILEICCTSNWGTLLSLSKSYEQVNTKLDSFLNICEPDTFHISIDHMCKQQTGEFFYFFTFLIYFMIWNAYELLIKKYHQKVRESNWYYIVM